MAKDSLFIKIKWVLCFCYRIVCLDTSCFQEYSTMPVDFHTHLFPPHIRTQRDHYCTLDPWFGQLYSNPHAQMASAEDLIAEMAASGVAASVAFSFSWTDPGLITETNNYILDAMHRYPQRIY